MEERARRIVETAVELAEQGGFEAVRLRDVASHAGVAMGTLYRRFRSKEDLLIAALELETQDLERRIRQRPPKGAHPRERVAAFFAVATRGLIRRPNLFRQQQPKNAPYLYHFGRSMMVLSYFRLGLGFGLPFEVCLRL